MNYIQRYDVDVECERKLELELAIDIIKEQHECKWNKFAHTDYKLDYTEIPTYQKILRGMIMPHLEEYAAQWYCREIVICSMWFAEYYDGASFGWHTHEGSNMSGVYAIDLSDPQDATQLINFDNPMNSGQLILFPSMVPHRSPTVDNDRYKLIVGFNWNMFGCTYPIKP